MKLDEFITNVLKDINNGLEKAKEETHRGYIVEVSGSKGVSFDIAVTTSYTNSIGGKGKAKIGVIEVLGAGVEVKASENNEKSEASRIQFTVYVPPKTKEEENADYQMIQAANARNAEKFSSIY